MTTYLRKLSTTQWAWLLGCLALCAAIVAVGWLVSPTDSPSLPDLTTDMSIREIAPKLDVTGESFGADCYSCARCLNVCPREAIAYRSIFAKPSWDQSEDADSNGGKATAANGARPAE